VKDSKGQVKKMGISPYRVRPIPKPTPMLGSIEASGAYSAGVLKAATFIYLQLKRFCFRRCEVYTGRILPGISNHVKVMQEHEKGNSAAMYS
jgi:hypothetical protein